MRVPLLAGLLVVCVFVGLMLWAAEGHVVAQLSDFYVVAQYARAFAEGHPFRYNPGEAPTTGSTSLLHTAVLGLAHAVGFRGEGLVAFAAVAKAYEKTRGVEGLGQGDWKLAAMLGAFLGWQSMLLTVLLASLAGTIVGLGAIALRGRDMRYALPLGTFLGAAGVLVVFAGDAIVGWYRGLLGA